MDTLEVLAERITELAAHYKALSKSFQVLNDNHHKLDKSFTRLETEWETNKAWIKYILGSTLIGTMVGILSLLKTFGVI